MIDQIVKEIRAALANGSFILALMGALTLPDLCGKAEYPNERDSTERYKKWYREWIGKYEKNPDGDELMPFLDEDLICDLRGCLFHEGKPSVNLLSHHLKRFELIKTKGVYRGAVASYEDNGINRTLSIPVGNLVFKLCTCAENYYKKNKEKFSFDYTLADDPF